MRSLRDLTPDTITCTDSNLNIFKATTRDLTFTVRQPRKHHTRAHKQAWRKLSQDTVQHYKRKYEPDKLYDSKYRCNLPPYRGEVPGWIPLIMLLDGEIVGFGDMFFKYGEEYLVHRLEDDEVGCSMSLCVLDKYQGMGVGSYYSYLSVFIARHFKADWALGYTQYHGGMFNIRMREGWEHVGRRGGWAVIQKRL